MKEYNRAFIFSGIMYAATLVLGIIIARLHLSQGHGGIYVPTLALQESRGFILTIVFIVSLLFLLRVIHSKHVTLSLMLLVVLALGTHYAIDAFQKLPPGTFVIALVIVSLATIVPMVISHDIGIVFGIAGVSALVGVTMSPAVAILVMVVMSVYDLFSVSRGHMVRYAGHMIESGAVFGFIVPTHFSGFFRRREEALNNGTVLLVGSIDVALPLLLASAAANQGIIGAILTAAGALVGLSIAHVLLMRRRKTAYVSALPPIASTSIFGYLTKIVLKL